VPSIALGTKNVTSYIVMSFFSVDILNVPLFGPQVLLIFTSLESSLPLHHANFYPLPEGSQVQIFSSDIYFAIQMSISNYILDMCI
jgi:hypothetical protein